MNAYAHICPKCDHEAWRHGLVEDHGVDGPYRCECGCLIMQSDPTRELNKQEYNAWRATR